jgi:hypothetical protein
MKFTSGFQFDSYIYGTIEVNHVTFYIETDHTHMYKFLLNTILIQ